VGIPRRLREVEERFEQIERSLLPGIVEAVWVSDRRQLAILLDGIKQRRDFSHAEVVVDGQVLASTGQAKTEARMTRRWPLEYEYRGRRQAIGELVVDADLEVTRARFVERAVFIVGANVAKTALVALFMFLLVHRLVTRHLEGFARHVGQASFENLNTPVVLERKPPPQPDELDALVAAYNNLRENLTDSYNRIRPLFQAVEQSPVSIFVTDTSGNIEYANRHFTKVTGYRAEEVIGRNPRLFKSGQTPVAVYKDMWQTITGGGIWTGRLYNRRKDGGLYWEETVIAAIIDEHGRIANYVAIKEDITERVEAERHIRELNESLERRVAERTAELERANKELESFSSSVSHDLRAPLRAINGFSRLLLENERARLSDDGRGMLDRESAARMQRLIVDLLGYARAGSAELAMEPVDLDEVMGQVVADLGPQIRETGAQVTWEALPSVRGSRSLLPHVLQNLVGNALKFHGATTPRVRVSARLLPEGTPGHRWEVSVHDNGIGIEERHLGRIFRPFERLHPQDRYPGSGIGLALCARIVERHGERITVQSTPGEGSRFSFTCRGVAGG